MNNNYRPRGTARLKVCNGRLFVRFPRSLFEGQDKTLALGLSDTTENRTKAEQKIKAINADIVLNQFDFTLDRYRLPKPVKTQSQIEVVSSNLSLVNLYELFMEYQKPIRKESTYTYYKRVILPLIKECAIYSPYQALAVREWLITNKTESLTKRVLQGINKAFDWGITHCLVNGKNPYTGMAKEFKHNYESNDPQPNAFSELQKYQVLEAFKSHNGALNKRGYRTGYKYSHYYPLVRFMFLTGCRPSEAIGLTFEQINFKEGYILFDRSITSVCGKIIWSKRSKTNRVRKFPLYPELQEALADVSVGVHPEQLVFPSPRGKIISYDNFSQRSWKSLVDPIKPDTTPYSCRDTFITEQITKGALPSVVAKWCDTSVKMIEKFYLDTEQITHIMPIH
jgi:integrase